jgi:hypothetical protein
MADLSFINTIIEKIPSLATSLLNWIKLSTSQGKVINILITLIIVYIGIKIIKEPIRWIIIILSIILIIQAGMSFA